MQNHKFDQLASPLANKIEVDGEQYLYFGGTAYLGIPRNQKFIRHYLNGIKKFGLNNGTSRNNNVQLGIYKEAEKHAAEKFGFADALITSSGYLAAKLTIAQAFTMGEVRYAPATHPALWQNEMPKVSSSFTDWSLSIVNEINNSEKINWVIISNSMNNLYPEIYDFSFLKKIDSHKRIVLIVDDSHGIGINNNGLSAMSIIPQGDHVEILLVASMAKALGVDAGIVLGSEKNISLLKQSNEFLGASPPAAAGLYAFMQSDDIYAAALLKLKKNIKVLSKALKKEDNWRFLSNFPVFFSKNTDISENLLKQQILISSFPYPDVDGAIVNRIVLCAWHSTANIKKLITSL